MNHLESSPRLSGILLHPTSLPGRFGIGELGQEARRFVDVMAASGQRLWQVLPLGPTYEPWFSPYSSISAFAGTPLVISLEALHEQGLLGADDLESEARLPAGRVDFQRVAELKGALLVRAGQAFQRRASPALRQSFEQFEHEERAWLEDYALFMVLTAHLGRTWRHWDEGLCMHEPSALEEARRRWSDEVFHQKYLQFEFHRQWSDLRRYANVRGLKLVGDVPIYVSQNSADVWAHREYFQLKPDRRHLRVVSGAPPDNVFSSEGQRWGTPVYDWPRLAQEDYRWWVDRLRHGLRHYDYLRLDHFPGFESYWAIPTEHLSAKDGHWEQGPRDALFDAVRRQMGELPVVVEDLGFVTPAMHALRDRLGFPGVFVLQYAFAPGLSERPYHRGQNIVVYTGTHDTNTCAGWFQALSDPERRVVTDYLGDSEVVEVPREMMRLAWASVARWAVAPLQDVMGLGAEARMNRPGIGHPENWSWRFTWEQLRDGDLERLAAFTRIYGRAP